MSTPLSPFYKSGNLAFISGQVGLDPTTGRIPDDFESQVDNVFKNIQHVLQSIGIGRNSVVKTTVNMTDLSLFSQMNERYLEFFGDHRPARTTIGVAALPEFPGDPTVFIEIEAVAEVAA